MTISTSVSFPRSTPKGCGSCRVGARRLFVLFAFGFATLVLPGARSARAGAGPLDVVGVARASSAQGSAIAVDRALGRAVGVVVGRYVPPEVFRRHRKWIGRRILGRSRRYVLRYAIAAQRWVPDGIEVEVETTVDRGRLLSDLAAGGVEVRRLSAWPRLLVVAAEDDPLAKSMMAELRDQGARVGSLAVSTEIQDGPDEWASAARGLGYHLVVVVAGEAVADEVEPDDLFSRESVRPEASARGAVWVLDARTLEVYGQAEAHGSVAAPSVGDALRGARTRVSRELARKAVASIEQSGWVPGGGVFEVDLVVTGLPDARALDEVGAALGGLAEVGAARLREIGYRSGRWRLEVSDPDMVWETALSAVAPPRGHLFWLGNSAEDDEAAPLTVEARWVP